MSVALVGATGFVGSHLQRQMHFDAMLSSANITAFRGRRFDVAVVAAGDARKWFANAHPAEDMVHIDRLINDLAAIECGRIIHLSTVDVYAERAGFERDLPGSVAADAYGGNRYRLEQALRLRCSDVSTVRLPGLFGVGLKKNLIFDISQRRPLDGFHPDSSFQWFDMNEIGRVVRVVDFTKIREVNVCATPVSVAELLSFVGLPVGLASPTAPLVRYDVRTEHAALFGGVGDYLYSKSESLARIESFLSLA